MATTNQTIRTIGVTFNGQGVALSGTLTGCILIPWSGTITAWYVVADVSGSATLGLRSVATGSYTGTAGYSGYTDVTGGGTAPSLSSATFNSSSTLTSWVTSVTANTIYCSQLTSPANATVVTLSVTVDAN